MRYGFYRAAASLLVLGLAAAGQNLTVTNYQFVEEQRFSRTESFITYRADLINGGGARAASAASVASTSASIQTVPGRTNLHFPPVPAGGRVTSLDTFTVFVDRSADTSLSSLQWNFSIPYAVAGPNQSVRIGSTVTLNGSQSTNPSGVGNLSYFWRFSQRPPGTAAVLLGSDGVMPVFVADVAGDYVLTLTVNNGAGSDTASLVVTAGGTTNTPPVANAGPNQTVAVNSVVTLNGSQSSDIDGDPLTYSWVLLSRPTGSTATLSSVTSVMPTFIADKPGTYVARLIVRDGMADSAPSTVQITTVNTPPVANAGPDQTVAFGATVQLTAAGSTDVDGDPLTYNWSFNSRPSGSSATLTNPTAVNPTFVADRAGVFVVQVIVSDGKATSTATVMISTNPAGAPTANAGPNQTVVHGASVTLAGSGTDPQNLPLTFFWSLTTKPANSAATLSSTSIPNPTFVADKPGNYVAQLIVNNGSQSSAPSTVTITTTNTAPVANAGPPQSVTVTQIVSLDGSGSTDADGDALSYSWSLTTRPAGSSAVLSAANSKTPTFVADVVGTFVAQLIVSDPFVSSVPSTVTITVTGNPNIGLPTGLSVPIGQSAMFPITLPVPAPANGLIVTLRAANSNLSFTAPECPTTPCVPNLTAQVTVTIGPGMTQPQIQPRVWGYSAGNVVITANALGYPTATAQVQVTGSFAFAVPSVSIGGTSRVNVFLILSGPAPAPPTGLPVTFTSSDYGVATVPANFTMFWDGSSPTSLNVPITGVGPGTAVIRASAAGYADATLNVTVQGALAIASNSLPIGIQGSPYNGPVVATGGNSPYTWSASNLPGGLSINSSTGVITGLPTQVGSSQVAISVTDSSNPQQSASKTLQLAVQGPFRIVTSVLPNGVVGTAYSLNLTATGGSSPYTWSATGLPAGLTISAAGLISGTPTAAGTSTVAITVIDASSPTPITATLSLPLVVVAPLSITTSTLPSGSVGVAYSATAAATGGFPGYSWSASGLPAGLTINATTGAISGTPTAAANSVVTLTVTDSSSPALSATRSLNLVVLAGLVITTNSLPNGVAGTAYSATVSGAGGTPGYTFTASGLPAGLSMSVAGQITGTTAVAGTATVNITLTDSGTPQQTASKSLSLTISAALAITTASLPNGVVNVAYTAPLAATGGSPAYTWSATGLPGGLSINSSTGQISGTPTATGTSTVAVTVTDAGTPQQTATKNLSLVIGSAVMITTTSLPAGVVNSSYSAALAAVGGTAPYSWSVANLPAGLSVNQSTGAISGTPTAAGTTTVAVTVTDSVGQTASANLSIVIAPALSITTSSLPGGVANAPYNTTLAATGGTPGYTWAATGLPAGLNINTSAGVISGTPTAAGSSTVNLTVTDSAGRTATASLPLTIGPELSITTASLPGASVNASYSTQLAATGGSPTYTWSATGLPSGLSMNQIGVISGTPTAVGTSSVVVTVTDLVGRTATKTFSLVVASGVTISTTSLPNGVVNTFYIGQIDATGGVPPYNITVNTVPPGLGFNGSNGALTGTPTVAAVTTMTFTVTDSVGGTATKDLTLTIIAPPVNIVTNSLPNAVVGTSYTTTLVGSGGTTPYTWAAAPLPAGLVVNANTGIITGTPTALGTTNVVITLTGSLGQTATKTLPLVVGTSGGGGGGINVTGATVGKDLQTNIILSLPGPADSDTLVQLSSDNPNVLLGATGRQAIQVTIVAGQTSVPVFVQGLASTGSATLTGSSAGFASGVGVIVLAPSGFVLEGPNGLSPPFPTTFQAFANVITNMLVSTARLDANGRFVEKQIIRASFGTGTIAVPVNTTSNGTLSTGAVNFTAGDSSQAFTFRGIATGSATITASVPSGFNAVTDSSNVVVANVLSSGLIPENVTVGRNLAATAKVTLNGVAPAAGLSLTISTNNNTMFKLSASPTAAGQDSITLNLPANARVSPDFYVYGLQSSGSATYQVIGPNFGSAQGTVTLAPSGVVFATSDGQPPNPILTTPGSPASTVAIYTGILNGSGNFVVPAQPVAGGLSVTTNVSVSNPSVGSVTPTATIAGGLLTTNVQFTPGAAGTTTINLGTPPAGFSQPSTQYSQIAVNNRVAGINCTDGVPIGNNLQIGGQCTLGAPTSGSTTFTLISNSANLRFSAGATTAGLATQTITVPGGRTFFTYFMQSFSSSGTVGYTVSASGYQTGNASVTLTPSALVIGNVVDLPFGSVLVGGTATLNIYTAQLNSATNTFNERQSLRGGFDITASVTSGNPGIASVPGTVVIPSGRDVNTPVTVTVQGVSAGSTTISVSNANFGSAGSSGFNLASTMSLNVNP